MGWRGHDDSFLFSVVFMVYSDWRLLAAALRRKACTVEVYGGSVASMEV
ncbi:hypothetical protein [Halobacillus kuroshimensis]|nr:hypothetical protein [Halobacillus kuroshimensis]